MNDELRNRIEQAINRGLADWDEAEGDTRTDTERAAQAIIDELGLRVETMTLGGMRSEGAPFASSRIVGRWEAEA